MTTRDGRPPNRTGDPPRTGVAADDPRNHGVIGHFRPPKVDAAYLRDRLGASMPCAAAEQVEVRVGEVLARIAATPHRPPPPLSQPLEAAPDPWFGLGTHPDIIEHLWELDGALPQSCRWLVWGFPALVHPGTGVIFAIGFGTIGTVIRLPTGEREGASAMRLTNPGRHYDISPAGPEWRFLPRENEQACCRAAYRFAGAAD